ncbi:hypothetical protein DXV76_17955 [Rhodobacteraceae bacterium CCMM004]|nr:hypothetical protein DXV76_17955 [Rhodobacteraceae bacterium CCMM004]
MFHAISEAIVGPLGAGRPDDPPFREVYETLYRLPDHAHVEKVCKSLTAANFPPAILNFARQFVIFKNKRQMADYHPLARFNRSTVATDVETVDAVRRAFAAADPVERTRFAFRVSVRERRRD